jgi:hypothetical protein
MVSQFTRADRHDFPGHVDKPFQAKQQWLVLRQAEEPVELPAILGAPA